MDKTLKQYFAQLRKIEEHRSKTAEKEIRKIYKTMLKDLQHFISDEYVRLAEDGELTYEILHGKGEFARFLEEVESHLNGISPKVAREIRSAVNEIYKMNYDGMVEAVSNAKDTEQLHEAFKAVKGATPEVVKRAVENPIAGLTLNDVLEKNRREIIYDVKKQIGIGLTQGDRMSTMAKRIATSLDGDYNKAVRIVRTEVHRVREAGLNDAATRIDETLQDGISGMRMVKTWKTMKDERVRPQRRYKTKKGWKTTRGSGANHQRMEGQTVLQDEPFDFGDGVKTMAPGQSGVAAHDINCRCRISRDLMDDAKYFELTGKHFPGYKEEGITEAEEAAITWYKGKDSYGINAKIRDGVEMTDHEKEMVKALDSAIEKLPAYKGDVTRSLYFMYEEDQDAFLAEHVVGNKITYKAFTSATTGETYNPDGQVQMIIKAKDGRDMREYNPEEAEVLFRRNTSFLVLAKGKENGTHLLVLEEQ